MIKVNQKVVLQNCQLLKYGKDDLLNKISRWWINKPFEVKSLYKPMWLVKVEFEKKFLFSKSLILNTHMIVDGLTGIVRCVEGGEPFSFEQKCVDPEQYFQPDVSKEESLSIVKKNALQIKIKDKLSVRSIGFPSLYFKPVWIFREMDKGKIIYLMDGHTGILTKPIQA